MSVRKLRIITVIIFLLPKDSREESSDSKLIQFDINYDITVIHAHFLTINNILHKDSREESSDSKLIQFDINYDITVIHAHF